MTDNTLIGNRKLIASVFDYLHKNDDFDEKDTLFIEQLFEHALLEDLEEYGFVALGKLAIIALNLLKTHGKNDRYISIINIDKQVMPVNADLTSITLINDDIPFLFDSVMKELNARGLDIHLVLHPVLSLAGDEKSDQVQLYDKQKQQDEIKNKKRKSFIVIHVNKIEDKNELDDLNVSLEEVINNVFAAVKDCSVMRSRINEAINSLQVNTLQNIDNDERDETIHFLKWIVDNNFILIGMREYLLDGENKEDPLTFLTGKGFGILRDINVKVLRQGCKMVSFTPKLREFLKHPAPLIVTKANVRSLVHRRVHLDYIGVKLFSDAGNLIGELRIIGLFTSTAYTQSVQVIPYLRRQVDNVLKNAGFQPDSHSSRMLLNVLENYPRDELFQIEPALLTRFALAIMHLEEHPKLRMLPRIDKFNLFASIIVFIPRDRFSTDVRVKIGKYLAKCYNGRVSAFYPTFFEGVLVRVHYIIGHDDGNIPQIKSSILEDEVTKLTRNWIDDLCEAIKPDNDLLPIETPVHDLKTRYMNAFPASYQARFRNEISVLNVDILNIEKLIKTKYNIGCTFQFYPDHENNTHQIIFKVFSVGEPISLSKRVPIMENMGFNVINEDTYLIEPKDKKNIYLHHMWLKIPETTLKIKLVYQNVLNNLKRIHTLLNENREESKKIPLGYLYTCTFCDKLSEQLSSELLDYLQKGSFRQAKYQSYEPVEYLYAMLSQWGQNETELFSSQAKQCPHICREIIENDNPKEGKASLLERLCNALEQQAPDRLPSIDILRNCFLETMNNNLENDGYNMLTLRAALDLPSVCILRAYSRYLRQIPLPYDQFDLQNVLNRHTAITIDIISMFDARFDPSSPNLIPQREQAVKKIEIKIEKELHKVDVLSEDRIIRLFMKIIKATLRCNIFKHMLEKKFFDPTQPIAFKIASQKVDYLPQPKPHAEIWVYSPFVEGIHLRFGKVARGGLRWSNRQHDFRTEILGLVKAQQVKNAVIVPVGAKGGFYIKQNPDGRENILKNGQKAYKIFISNLLEMTDNLNDNTLIQPKNIVCHDSDDPYLVVAADKGTATFSDIANAIAQEKEFWLDDAFASGGKTGYDHKEMGITARGAWESVKRHFREMDWDIQTTPFTVIGVGDMSGDVFGNAMLLSQQIKLLAAFDHRHIFIDPNPDTEKSFAERKRMFQLKSSSWINYDQKIISSGGGIFPRDAKSIALSPPMQELTKIDREEATPFELINALLKAEADLLWFGGIGTYVRGDQENNSDVGDSDNDEVRITASELRTKVIGEGANLPITQRARIEFAQHGGRINTDAIDNSAGVNSSDLEVNIKIALSYAIRKKTMTIENRNSLLKNMTEDVARLVLQNNNLQTMSLSLTEHNGLNELSLQKRLMQKLEKLAVLDRKLEYLPSNADIKKREKDRKTLTRPELAVLLAYGKIALFNSLIASKAPDDEYLHRELMDYFPEQMRQKHAEGIARHTLRREIISTMLANSMINYGGSSFVIRMRERTNAEPEQITRAFVTVRDSFSLVKLNDSIDKLNNVISSKSQILLYRKLQDLLLDQTVWFVKTGISSSDELTGVIKRYAEGIQALLKSLDTVLTPEMRKEYEKEYSELIKQKIPDETARHLAALNILYMAPDIVLIAEKSGHSIDDVANIFFMIGDKLKIRYIKNKTKKLPAGDIYDRIAMNDILQKLADAQQKITIQILDRLKKDMKEYRQSIEEDKAQQVKRGQDSVYGEKLHKYNDIFEQWMGKKQAGGVKRVQETISNIEASSEAELHLSKFLCAANQLHSLT